MTDDFQKAISDFKQVCDPDAQQCFINLIKTPSGFEFDIHASGQRKPPQRLSKADKYLATYLLPFTPSKSHEFLQELTAVAGSKSPNSVAYIQRTLADFRWQPERKGFG